MIILETALGWALLHFLWQGALIALLLAVVLFLGRPRAGTRYASACAALLAMPIVFALTLAWMLAPGETHVAGPLARLVLAPAPPPGGPQSATSALVDDLRRLVPVWLVGVGLFYLHSLAAWIAAQRLRRVAVCLAPAAWQERLDLLARRLRLSRPVLLLESGLASVPVVIGFLRPAILIPAGLLTGFTPEHLESILVHELAHIRRNDYVVQLLQRFVEGLLFYHPAVWWISSVIRAEREHCCDDAAVAVVGDAHRYAAALAALEQSRSTEPALAASGGNLLRRIRRLLQPAEGPRASASLASTALLLIVAAVTWVAFAQPQAPPRIPPPVEAQALPEIPPRFQAWLEEVSYIIAPEEKAAFVRLLTDEEREHFIEQFWLRRDPTPGTPENEFKQEFYRRIAYANDRFAAGLPGWKTDRGRIYISYGPPDEIESHPAGPPAAFEEWRYRHIQGVGDNVIIHFDDPDRTGEYRMASDPSQNFTSKSGLTVHVTPDRHVTITMRPPGEGPAHLYCRITAGTRVLYTFDEAVAKGKVHQKMIPDPMPPGVYSLAVTTSDEPGRSQTESIVFAVK